MLFPIGFSIPECKIVKDIPEKTHHLSHLIPGKLETYIYNTEQDYYKEYQESVFAMTIKKGGWDCLRHYEILANGCIPYFVNIEQCPPVCLTLLPKDLIKEAMIASQATSFNYKMYIEKLLDYTRKYLTTESIAKYILDKSKLTSTKSVLFLSGNNYPDYLRCLTLHGFKSLFKSECHDYIDVKHLYDTYPEDKVKDLYGKGFTYTRLLSRKETRDDSRDDTIVEDIKKRRYDIVIFGSVHRGLPYFDLVLQHYPSNKIIYLCGEDGHSPKDYCVVNLLKDISPCFLRQEYDSTNTVYKPK